MRLETLQHHTSTSVHNYWYIIDMGESMMGRQEALHKQSIASGIISCVGEIRVYCSVTHAVLLKSTKSEQSCTSNSTTTRRSVNMPQSIILISHTLFFYQQN